MRRVRNAVRKSQPSTDAELPAPSQFAMALDDGTAMLALIQVLIPLGLKAVEDARAGGSSPALTLLVEPRLLTLASNL